MTSGPLAGIRVVEVAGIGPAPLGCMVLADLGAEVVRVDRSSGPGLSLVPYRKDILARGRRSVAVDLKAPGGADVVRRLADTADVFVEAFRPGVAERLGIGPDELLARNPRLVYARMTGWGQDGPLAQRAGHDIDYASIVGAIGAVGEPGRKPVAPLNLVADFGGGSMFLVTGVLAALLERATSGKGQVVDVAMVDGVSTLLAMLHSHRASGIWQDKRGSNLLDGGAPFYDTYECADGEWIAVGALERQFFAELVRVLGEATPGFAEELPEQHDMARWPEMRALFERTFATRTRDEWASLFDGVDACVAPVLSAGEAPQHPHVAARKTLVELHGLVQPAPAPRFSRTPGAISRPPRQPGEDSRDTLLDWGFAADEVDKLFADGVVAQPDDPERGVYGEAR
ncbi:MAG TPA: CaiB/BaiF CoA-transferase family protein [Mycobacteriales bacterium]|nr:CaiB/BaiF CoA-transferase family protein [Mycobacteriales bacterium]